MNSSIATTAKPASTSSTPSLLRKRRTVAFLHRTVVTVGERIHPHDRVATGQQRFAEARTDEPRAPGHEKATQHLTRGGADSDGTGSEPHRVRAETTERQAAMPDSH